MSAQSAHVDPGSSKVKPTGSPSLLSHQRAINWLKSHEILWKYHEITIVYHFQWLTLVSIRDFLLAKPPFSRPFPMSQESPSPLGPSRRVSRRLCRRRSMVGDFCGTRHPRAGQCLIPKKKRNKRFWPTPICLVDFDWCDMFDTVFWICVACLIRNLVVWRHYVVPKSLLANHHPNENCSFCLPLICWLHFITSPWYVLKIVYSIYLLRLIPPWELQVSIYPVVRERRSYGSYGYWGEPKGLRIEFPIGTW